MWEGIQRGEYSVNGKEFYFRSKWEANYALYLDFLKKQGTIKGWRYEPKIFEFPVQHGTTRYLPDFEVTNPDGSVEYHEVKGYLTGKAKVQLNRMKKFYPQVKLILVDKDGMKALNKWKKLLKFY